METIKIPEQTLQEILDQDIQLLKVLDFRIQRQFKLIERIRNGKFTFENYSPSFLESLAQMDIEALRVERRKLEAEKVSLTVKIELVNRQNVD